MKKHAKKLLGIFVLACLFTGIKVLCPVSTVHAAGVFNNVRQTDASSEYAEIKWNETESKNIDIYWTCYSDKAMTEWVDEGGPI